MANKDISDDDCNIIIPVVYEWFDNFYGSYVHAKKDGRYGANRQAEQRNSTI